MSDTQTKEKHRALNKTANEYGFLDYASSILERDFFRKIFVKR